MYKMNAKRVARIEAILEINDLIKNGKTKINIEAVVETIDTGELAHLKYSTLCGAVNAAIKELKLKTVTEGNYTYIIA